MHFVPELFNKNNEDLDFQNVFVSEHEIHVFRIKNSPLQMCRNFCCSYDLCTQCCLSSHCHGVTKG